MQPIRSHVSHRNYWKISRKVMTKTLLKSISNGRMFFGVAFLCVASSVVAAPVLTPYTAEYKVKISILGGRLTTGLQVTDEGYTATSSIKATGMSRMIARGEITEQSWFSETDSGLRPSRFVSSDTLSKGGEEVDLDFLWDRSLVSGLIGGQEFRTDINGNLQDRVSLQYALMHDLLNDIYLDSYSLQDAEKLKLLSVTNLGTKSVKVPFGTFEAIGLQHRAGTSSRVTTLWFAKKLGYLPVLIEQHRKGKLQVRATLRQYAAVEDATREAR